MKHNLPFCRSDEVNIPKVLKSGKMVKMSAVEAKIYIHYATFLT